MSEQWVWSTNEEHYGSDEFASREEALADARAEEPGRVVYTGRVHRLSLEEFAMVDADRVLEAMGARAYDEVGDVADDWPEWTREQEQELGDILTAALVEWAEKHIGDPTFFAVRECERHEPAPLPARVPDAP